jgi:hypothetical protein
MEYEADRSTGKIRNAGKIIYINYPSWNDCKGIFKNIKEATEMCSTINNALSRSYRSNHNSPDYPRNSMVRHSAAFSEQFSETAK